MYMQKIFFNKNNDELIVKLIKIIIIFKKNKLPTKHTESEE
jgi:hypothetical protein